MLYKCGKFEKSAPGPGYRLHNIVSYYHPTNIHFDRKMSGIHESNIII